VSRALRGADRWLRMSGRHCPNSIWIAGLGCLAGSFRQCEFRLAQKTAIGFKGDLRTAFWARNFNKNIEPLGLHKTQKPAIVTFVTRPLRGA
jgi:hypothetical protein